MANPWGSAEELPEEGRRWWDGPGAGDTPGGGGGGDGSVMVWNGSAMVSGTVKGVWTGSVIVSASVKGVWNGSGILPAAGGA